MGLNLNWAAILAPLLEKLIAALIEAIIKAIENGDQGKAMEGVAVLCDINELFDTKPLATVAAMADAIKAVS